MIQVQNNKKYDLEERTLKFAKNCRELVNKLKKTIANTEDGRQLIRSSGSVMANYIEANEAISKKDFWGNIGKIQMIVWKLSFEVCYLFGI